MNLKSLLTFGAFGATAFLLMSGVLPCPLSSAAVENRGDVGEASPAGVHVASPTKVAPPMKEGDAPSMEWIDSDGTKRSLADYSGKVVLVNFWATWCPPCRRELPDLVRMRESMKARGVEVIGISVGERPDAGTSVQEHVGRYAQRIGITYPLVLGDQAVVDAFGGVRALPTSFLIGPDGRIVEVIVGARDEKTFAAMIESALAK